MPGRASSAAGDSPATGSASSSIVSAAVRYARILKGFSFLISRRSAISARIRAIARLSTAVQTAHRRSGDSERIDDEAARLDREIEHAGARFAHGLADVGDVGRVAEAKEAAAPAGAAD